jgi:alginate O-acetyltransferase complex protein AlgI
MGADSPSAPNTCLAPDSTAPDVPRRCLGWVFFRAPSFNIAFTVFHRLTTPGMLTLSTGPIVLALALGLAGQFQPLRWRRALECEIGRWPALLRGAAFAAVISAIELLGPSCVAPFIYFQY